MERISCFPSLLPVWRKTTLRASLLCVVLPLALLARPSLAAPEAKIALYWLKEDPNSVKTLSHGIWTDLLQRYVKPYSSNTSRVDYSEFKHHGLKTLQKYLRVMQTLKPTTYRREEQFPYWLNLYNATIMGIIVQSYPVRSIRDVKVGGLMKGPWAQKILRVEGKALSLDDIEHRILRPIWRDKRIHYGLSSASVGSPNVLREAFTVNNVGILLNTNADHFINHPRGVQLRNGKLHVSSVYHWYMKDFGEGMPDLIKHLRQHAKPPLRRVLRGYNSGYTHAFEWKLNDQHKNRRY